MTQTASIDLGALAAAPRRDYASVPKPETDFAETYRKAEQTAPEPRKYDRPERPDTDRNEPTNTQPSDAAAPDAIAEAPPKAEQPKAEAPKAEQPKAEAPKAETGEATDAPPSQSTEDAQAALALALATGGQIVPLIQPTEAGAEAAAGATLEALEGTEADAPRVAVPANQAVTAAAEEAIALADAEAIAAEAAKTQADEQVLVETTLHSRQVATQKAQAPQAAQAAEHASENAKLPAFLAQAAQGLGKVTMTATTEQASTPTAPTATEVDPEAGNLAIQLLDEAPAPVTTGSNTQATLLDDATDIETAFHAVTGEGEETAEGAITTEDGNEGLAALNGDKAQVHGGRAAEAKAPVQQPPQPEEVLPQVLKHAEQLKTNQQSSIKLNLYPEHLGRLEIKVSTHQGVVQATLTADTPQVKGLLEGQMAHLQRSFAEMGLKVDKVEVALASSNMQFDASGQMGPGPGDQGFGQQERSGHARQANAFSGSGYEQWLPEEVADEGYMDLAGATAINFVA